VTRPLFCDPVENDGVWTCTRCGFSLRCPTAFTRQCTGEPRQGESLELTAEEWEEFAAQMRTRIDAGLGTATHAALERRLSICRWCTALMPPRRDAAIRCRRDGGCVDKAVGCFRERMTDAAGVCPDDEWNKPTQPIRVRNLIYHVYASKANDLWRMNVRQLVRRWHVFNGRQVIAIATGPGIHPPDVVKSEFFNPPGVEWLEIPNDARLREVATFLPLLEAIQSTSADEASFYAHTKGNSTADDAQGAMRWRNMMYSRLLDEPATIMEQLRTAPCVGTTKIVWRRGDRGPYPTALRYGNGMIARTFFWFRHDRVFGHPRWGKVPDDRYGAEAWLSGLFADHEGISVNQPWPAPDYPSPNPYTPALYHWRYDDPEEAQPQ